MAHNDYDYFDKQTGEGLWDHELMERYDQDLDELYGDVMVAGFLYGTAATLKQVDDVAYRCGYVDWIDNQLGETLVEMIEDADTYEGEV